MEPARHGGALGCGLSHARCRQHKRDRAFSRGRWRRSRGGRTSLTPGPHPHELTTRLDPPGPRARSRPARRRRVGAGAARLPAGVARRGGAGARPRPVGVPLGARRAAAHADAGAAPRALGGVRHERRCAPPLLAGRGGLRRRRLQPGARHPAGLAGPGALRRWRPRAVVAAGRRGRAAAAHPLPGPRAARCPGVAPLRAARRRARGGAGRRIARGRGRGRRALARAALPGERPRTGREARALLEGVRGLARNQGLPGD